MYTLSTYCVIDHADIYFCEASRCCTSAESRRSVENKNRSLSEIRDSLADRRQKRLCLMARADADPCMRSDERLIISSIGSESPECLSRLYFGGSSRGPSVSDDHFLANRIIELHICRAEVAAQ